jgi:hypothetical protein
MPDPIRSATPSPIPAYQDAECVDPLLGGTSSATSQSGSEAAQGVCQSAQASKPESAAPRAEPAKLPPAVQSLVTSNSRPNAAAQFVQNQKQVAATTAERTAQTPLKPLYAAAGTTADSAYATAGVFYGRDPKSGVTEELGTVSAQIGAQTELQITGLRMGLQNENGDALGVEALSAQLGYGVHNKDGSTGFNISGGVTLIGVEGTQDQGDGNTTTTGVSVAAAFEASVGLKDADGDGKQELCARLALPGIPVFGGCLEEDQAPQSALR